jgi:hypothetical protein
MKAHKAQTVLSEGGILMLQGLLFHAGDALEVIISERSPSISEAESLSPVKKAVAQPKPNFYQLQGTVFS